MVIKHSPSGLYDLPAGDPLSGESAQCTAHRHTWEQTGMNVEVDQLLGVTQPGVMIFSCNINNGFTSKDGPLPPPDWTTGNIQQIEFINPFDTRYNAWLQPDNLIMYRDGFTETNDSQNQQVPAQSL